MCFARTRAVRFRVRHGRYRGFLHAARQTVYNNNGALRPAAAVSEPALPLFDAYLRPFGSQLRENDSKRINR